MFENRKLIESFKKLSKWRPLLNYQWHIIPLLNPDGYSKSHEVDTHGKRKINFPLEVHVYTYIVILMYTASNEN